MKVLATVLAVLGGQTVAYVLIVHRRIVGWGATAAERRRPMPGDDPAARIGRSTRAVTIEAPRSEVWSWLIQLGADRGGFFSYAFIERTLGYDKQGTGLFPQSQDLEVGRIIPGSLKGATPLITFNFPVLAVEPSRSFVLKNWGNFWLDDLDEGATRLVVRTWGKKPSGPLTRVRGIAWTVMHYLMERRMLLGLKARAEAGPGVRLPEVPDNLWLAGLALSGLGTALLAIFGAGASGAVLSVALGLCWLLTLLLAPPLPVYSVTLALLVMLALVAGT